MSDLKKQKAIPFLSVAEIKTLGTELKEKYQHAETRVFGTHAFRAMLNTFVRPDDVVLDLGSANGHIFTILDAMGVTHTQGADIDNYLSKGFPREGFSTFDFNMDRYPYADGTFDVVTAIEVIEHLENPFHFVREIHRILRDKGTLILSTPNPSHIFNKVLFAYREQFYRFLAGNDHITLLTDPILKKGILTLFKRAEVAYLLPEMPWRFLRRFRYPANKHFGRVVLYAFKKK